MALRRHCLQLAGALCASLLATHSASGQTLQTGENPKPPGNDQPATEASAIKLLEKHNWEYTRDAKRSGAPIIGVRLTGKDVTPDVLKGLGPLKDLTSLDVDNAAL